MYLHRLPRLPRECTAKLKGKRVLRQRLIALVDLSEEVFYALTVEHVHGSEEHTFSFHGPNGDATPANLTLEPYNGATLGEGLECGDFSSTNAIDPELSCFAFLWEPAKGTPKGVWSLGYALREQEDIHLHMTSVYPKANELIVAKGKSPGGVSKYDMTWAIQHGHSESPLTTQYLYVLEPCQQLHHRKDRAFTRQRWQSQCAVSLARCAQYHSRGHRHDPAPRQGSTDCDRGRDHIRRRVRIVVKEQQQAHSSNACPRHKRPKTIPALRSLRRNPTGRSSLATGRALQSPSARSPLQWPDNLSDTFTSRTAMTTRYRTRSWMLNRSRMVAASAWASIREGFVKSCRDGVVTSETYLKLYPFGYYAGKTLGNETNDVFYRQRSGQRPGRHPRSRFCDRDRDGLCRFLIYDYGPGDHVTVENFAAIREN